MGSMRGNNPAVRCFVDTNIWLYALVVGEDALKHTTAKNIVQGAGVVVSTQIVNETCVNLLRKARLPEPQIHQSNKKYCCGRLAFESNTVCRFGIVSW